MPRSSAALEICPTREEKVFFTVSNLSLIHIYAVLPMDFTYTMDVPETIRCAKLIAAKHTIPVHMSPGKLFDMDRAKKLAVPGALIVKPGESIRL